MPSLRFLFRRAPLLLAPLVLVLALPAAEAERVYTVKGVVRASHDAQTGTISIQHEDIPGFMPAMTMPFYADAAEVKELSPGDRVEFEFRVGERSRATKFLQLGRESGRPEAPGASSRRRLRAGDEMPPFALIDQDGRPVTTETLRGKHTVATFVFTRCPVPEFCPLIGRKFQALQEGLHAPSGPSPEVQLLSISIDPEHDRPAVLRAYGESLGADFARWRFATGEAGEVARLAAAFAVRTERRAASLDHTLATALIGPEGRVVEIWRGNAWKPEEILAKVREPRGELRHPAAGAGRGTAPD